jgi:hypothetical protein
MSTFAIPELMLGSAAGPSIDHEDAALFGSHLRMGVAALYMIVTLKDGTVHTRAFRQENVDYCMRAQKNLPQALAWCIPDSRRLISVAR